MWRNWRRICRAAGGWARGDYQKRPLSCPFSPLLASAALRGKSSSDNKAAKKAISAASIAIRPPAPPPRSWPLLLIALDAEAEDMQPRGGGTGGGTPAFLPVFAAAAALIVLEAGRWMWRNWRRICRAAGGWARGDYQKRPLSCPFSPLLASAALRGKSSSDNKAAKKAISAASIAIRPPAPPPRSWPLLLIALDAEAEDMQPRGGGTGGGTPAFLPVFAAAAALIVLEAGRWRRRNRKGGGYAPAAAALTI